MKILRPRTFLNLILLGFALVSIPLGTVLWTTLSTIETMRDTSLGVVETAVKGTSDSEILPEFLRNEERTIRLFTITKEEQYLSQTLSYHLQINALLDDLLTLSLSAETKNKIGELLATRNKMRSIMERLNTEALSNGDTDALKTQIETFSRQQEMVGIIRDGVKEFVHAQVELLKTKTAMARRALVTQTSILILLTIVIMAVMAFLFSWPVNQLNRSVERLGDGDFKTPVRVTGPLDIEAVGEKLDWLRKRLDTLEQEKSKFLAHISHELKTPLASIREGTALLNEEIIGELNEKQRDVTHILVNNSLLLQKLIEDIIDFNMSQAGQKVLDFVEINLKELIEQSVSAQKASLIGKEITLDLKLDEARIFGDRKQIEAIYENLFSNAIKFSPVGGIVGCVLRSDKKRIASIVYDSGPGVAEEEKESIFYPFYQIDSSVKESVRGSGLGLAIAKEYIKNHNGSISLLNPGEDGARFGVTLPVAYPRSKEE